MAASCVIYERGLKGWHTINPPGSVLALQSSERTRRGETQHAQIGIGNVDTMQSRWNIVRYPARLP